MPAAAVPPDDFQALCLAIARDGQRDTRFEHRKNADQTLSDPVLLGNGLSHRFFRLTAGVRVRGFEIAVGTPGLFGSRLGVLDQGLGFALEKLTGIFEQNTTLVQVAAKRPVRKHRGQVALEDDAIKSFNYTQD